MKHFAALFLAINILVVAKITAQVEQSNPYCSTPNLDSATAVALPYYDNNQVLEDYLVQHGYDNLDYISMPGTNTRSTATFLEPQFLVPLNIYIYRDGANNPNSSITAIQARDFVCRVNEIFRNAGTAIQFYTNRIEFDPNDNFNSGISTGLNVYNMWVNKRLAPDNSKGINVHFVRYNNPPEDNFGRASLPHYLVPPFSEYSLYVRTHNNPSGTQRHPIDIAGTLAHEIGHTLGLLHTHHPGRLPSLIFNEENGTISNGCYQESVSRTRENHIYQGCFATEGKLKCEINGDFLCDTEADPNQTGRVAGCIYNNPANGDFREDNWGVLWNPPTNNVMSYSTHNCLDDFSRHQIGIMWMQMPHFKNFIDYQAPDIVSASGRVCYGSNTNFSLVGDLPNDAAVTWEVEPSNLVNNSNGTGTTASFSASTSSARGLASITFTLIGPGNCYIARLQESFWIGPPNSAANSVVYVPGFYGDNPVTLAKESLYTFQISNVPGATSYDWSLPSGFTFMSGQRIHGSSVNIWTPNSSGSYTLLCFPENTCGNNGTGHQSLTINLPGGGGSDPCPNPPCSIPIPRARSYPNPVDKDVTLDFKTIGNEVSSASYTGQIDQDTKEIVIYDGKMNIIDNIVTTDENLTFSTSNYVEGLYYVKIFINDEVIMKKVIVQH